MIDNNPADEVPPAPNMFNVWGAPLISMFTLVIFLVALVIAYIMKNETLVTAMLGVAAANATTVVNFWLGSSSGSHSKDVMISAQGRVIGDQANAIQSRPPS